MKVLIVDNEQLAIDNLTSLVQQHYPDCEIIASDTPLEAVDMFFDEHQLSSIKHALNNLNQHISKAAHKIVPIKEVGKIRIISIEDIEYLSGSGNYVEIFLKNGQMVLHRERMSTMEEKLNEEEFIRIHRSSIVRFSAISELMTSKRGDYTVKLKNGTELPVSRQFKAEILSYFR